MEATFSTLAKQTLWPTHLLYNGYSTPELNRSGRGVDNLPFSRSEAKNEWCHTPTPPASLHDMYREKSTFIFFNVVPCILITLIFLSPKNAPLYYTYKMLKYTARLSHYCSYMFRSTWTVIREPMPNLAKVTILWKYVVICSAMLW